MHGRVQGAESLDQGAEAAVVFDFEHPVEPRSPQVRIDEQDRATELSEAYGQVARNRGLAL